ncbi:MAG: ATP-NAD kinase family protein [Thermoplasmata archaeon]|nr:ATP-NAD kinase family protein [Thermoplasmata archaeon]
MVKVGFLINPIAGMGGRVGLKGTDGVLGQAMELGAEPVAREKAEIMLSRLRELIYIRELDWLTCCGDMGAKALDEAGFDFSITYDAIENTSQKDTLAAAKSFMDAGVDLIVFCGGDGTARDIVSMVEKNVPVLGIPSGVKMYSGVFGVSPARTAEVLAGFLNGELELADVEIMDLDEDKYRQGDWSVRLYYSAMTPFESTLVQSSKMMIEAASDEAIKEEIGEYIEELISEEPDTLFLLGPGGTLEFISKMLGMEKTLLGIDAIAGGQQVGDDLNEEGILQLFEKYNKIKLILSPIGSQGFVLGRGNLQLSPKVIQKIGRENILIVSTPAKLHRTPKLRFDTGDAGLNSELAGRGWFSVVIGYRLSRLAEVSI